MTGFRIVARLATLSLLLVAPLTFAKSAYQRETVDQLERPVDQPFRIAVGGCDNECKVSVDGQEEGHAIGLNNDFVVRIDPYLRKGEVTMVEFFGINWRRTSLSANPWEFRVETQDSIGGKWESYKDYEEVSKGWPNDNPPPGNAYHLVLHIKGT